MFQEGLKDLEGNEEEDSAENTADDCVDECRAR
jgi:hypothetical protein